MPGLHVLIGKGSSLFLDFFAPFLISPLLERKRMRGAFDLLFVWFPSNALKSCYLVFPWWAWAAKGGPVRFQVVAAVAGLPPPPPPPQAVDDRSPQIQIRTEFPETWIFDAVEME